MKRTIVLATTAVFTLAIALSASGAARADTTVAPAAVHVAVTLGAPNEMSLVVDKPSVPAGPVVFDITNTGRMEHEFVILKTDIAAGSLPPSLDDPLKAAEIGHVDEVDPVEAGKTETLAVTLTPGRYVLVCNKAGHYAAGMYTAFTVTSPVAVTETDRAITLDRTFAIGGAVTFTIANTGALTHELVVVKTDVADGALPASADEPGTVDETGNVGEAEDIGAGASTTLTLTLAPGKYVLICNMAGHYALGMHTAFTILPTEPTAAAAARDVALAEMGLEDLADIDARVDVQALLTAPGIVVTAADRAAIAAGYIPRAVASDGTLVY